MIFVVAYDRGKGKVLSLRRFATQRREAAHRLRRRLELETAERHSDVEVVILEAPTEAALRRTHGRYFGGVRDIVDRAGARSAG